MTERLADVRVSMLGERDLRLLVAITGLSARQVTARVTRAHGNTLAGRIFSDEWPEDSARLEGITVAAARDANLEQELVAATGLSLRTVRARLNKEHGKSLLANVFQELVEGEDESDDNDDNDDEDDEQEELEEADDENGDHEQEEHDDAVRPGSQRRFLDAERDFAVFELVGAIPAAALRRAPPLLNWLARRVDLSARSLSAKARAANGRTLLSTLLPGQPISALGPSRAMLSELRVATAMRAPSLLRWVADVADVEPKEVVRRLEAANGNTKLARVIPELVGEATSEAEGEEEEEKERKTPAPERRRKTEDSELPPSQRTRRIVSGRYELRRRLGEGGFGVAWEAMRLEHPRKLVVLKTSSDPARARLREEMGIAWDLRHQNICTYIDYGCDPTVGTYLVMDHGGTSLERIIESGDSLALAVAIEVVRQAAAGLDYAHKKGVLHQDVKPGNVLVKTTTSPWEVRLGDFGIAVQGRTGKNTVGNTTVFATAPVAYTRAYAAPEQLRGEKAQRKTDQYALALVFCSMLEGLVFKRRYKPREFGRLSNRQNTAVARALRDAPSERFETCSDFAAALGRG
ncbi:MAG: serine/threonine protein kinase [Candidatus Eisenbacteria bacterium]|nr:serine/threonine protein kinase [Candidatus Eisenbacteria bacterium]